MTRGVVIAFCCAASIASAEQKLLDISWPASLPDGVSLGTDGSLTVTSTSDEGLTVTLVEIESPGITKDRYAVKGRVRYENVSDESHVEMWSVFSEGSYFSRTDAELGSFDWRPLALPFDKTGASAPPERLIVNVVLPGRGEVAVSPLTLVELEAGEWPSSGGAAAGLWGGVAGAVLGVVAGLLGWLGGMGKAKRLVLPGFRLIMAAGAVALALGLLSLIRGMPYHVYYPFLLLGAIALLVPASTLPRLQKRYEELELRRMSALDA